MKHFLCKYIPPRSDFLATLTPAEREWMAQHGAYLNALMHQGRVVAHGPVIDAQGGYGVSLFQIEDDEDIAALTGQDPIVLNGAGHYEHYAMPHLTFRN